MNIPGAIPPPQTRDRETSRYLEDIREVSQIEEVVESHGRGCKVVAHCLMDRDRCLHQGGATPEHRGAEGVLPETGTEDLAIDGAQRLQGRKVEGKHCEMSLKRKTHMRITQK